MLGVVVGVRAVELPEAQAPVTTRARRANRVTSGNLRFLVWRWPRHCITTEVLEVLEVLEVSCSPLEHLEHVEHFEHLSGSCG